MFSKKKAPLAQLVRASVLWAEGQWFEPTMEHFFARLAQSVERTPFKRVVVGSSPTSGEYQSGAEEACRIHNPKVGWSKHPFDSVKVCLSHKLDQSDFCKVI